MVRLWYRVDGEVRHEFFFVIKRVQKNITERKINFTVTEKIKTKQKMSDHVFM